MWAELTGLMNRIHMTDKIITYDAIRNGTSVYALKIGGYGMKRFFIILGIIVLLFSGCAKDVTTTSSQNNDYPVKESITVKKHHISRLLNGNAYWYSNTNAEKVLNYINQRDKKVLKEIISKSSQAESDIEKQLENLSNILEKKLSEDGAREAEMPVTPKASPKNLENFKFMKMLYRTMLNNDVNEKYVNQILDEAEKVTNSGSNVDIILSNVYQKMILKLGEPNCIDLSGKKPHVIFFVGPTGVGKTTTIAKIAAKYKVEHDKKVAMLTADTYRIAAAEQLKIYANILDAPVKIIYSAEELNQSLETLAEYDLVFVDTAGFSHKNEEQREDIKKLVNGLDLKYEKEVYLVLSATTKYKDLMEIVDIYREIAEYKIIFTKLDETTSFGNILNIRLYSGADLSYMTNGQSVPDDLEVFNTQMVVKQLLGGK